MASRRKTGKGVGSLFPSAGKAGAKKTPDPFSWVRIALIVIVGAIVYANGLSGPFVLDDQDTVVLNEQIRQLWPPSVVLAPAVELPVAGRPVVNVSFALNYAAGGLEVRGYHVVNVAIHVLCALLLFGIVRRTLTLPPLRERFGPRSADLALAVALIWIVHPLLTDAVDYLTQRTELLLGLFYLLTLYASIRGVNGWRWLAGAVVACALGMGSKESMVTAPLMVVLYDRVFLFESLRSAWRRRWAFYLALAATWLPLAALVASGPRFRSAGFSAGVSPWTYLLNQTLMIVHYLRLAVWPRGLVVDYGVPLPLTAGAVWPYGLIVLMLAALTIAALVVAPKLGFLGAWFFITLAPTSSIVPIVTEVGAERRMYLPLAALVVLAVVGVAWLLERSARAPASPDATRRAHFAGLAALALLIVALAAGTIARNREFASSVALARSTVERRPSARARNSLGLALIEAGRRDEGVGFLRQAAAADPEWEYSLGAALFQEGRLDEAVQHLRVFLAHDSIRLEVPVAHDMIGRVLKTRGRLDDATAEFRQVLSMTPSNADERRLLAETLMLQQNYVDAVAQYQTYLNYRPNDVSALMQLGIAFTALGRGDDAIAMFRRVVDVNPRDGGAQRNLALALIGKGAFDEAAGHARLAAELRPGDPVAHDELGVALAGEGQLDEAIAELQRSLQIDPNDQDVRGHLAATLAARNSRPRPNGR
jgi:protein O-mannosyl-transferase